MKKILLISIALFYSVIIVAKPRQVNPLDYGLKEARNGIERYNVLLRCHKEAIKSGYGVCYKGIGTLEIEIPSSPESIPLPSFTDFANLRLTVTNCKKSNFFLFSRKNNLTSIEIKPGDVDTANFLSYPEIRNSQCLLVVEDENIWSDRLNYNNLQAYRKDVMMVENGLSNSFPIIKYDSPSSKCTTKYCMASNTQKVIKNLNFVRTSNSIYKTFLLSVENEYRIDISNISITTPQNDKEYADMAICVMNCVDLVLKDIFINGTYSLPNKVGYGVHLNNIYDLKVIRMYARANWGVFGTHNLHRVLLKDCDINRFDIHTYGRDVRAVNCKFSGLYNQFSSVYGAVVFEKCTFTDFIPVLIESSYNSYTPFDLIWKDCTFNLDKNHNYLMTLFGVKEPYNERPELRRKCLPNVTMQNCKVVLADDVDKWYLVKTGSVKYKDSFDYITNITIIGLKVVNEGNREFELFTENVKTTNAVNINIKRKK